MKLFKNSLFVFVALMAASQVQAMDIFDFGDDVQAALGAWSDEDLKDHVEAILADSGHIEITTAVQEALVALLAVPDNSVDLHKVKEAFSDYLPTNLAALNDALGQDGADLKGIMGKSFFAAVKDHLGNGLFIQATVSEIMTAWKSIIQTTISRAMLIAASKAHAKRFAAVKQLRLEYAAAETEAAQVQSDAKTTHAQLLAGTKGQEVVAKELEARLRITGAGINATKSATTEGKGIVSSK